MPFVYVASNPSLPGILKIGKSKDANKRLATLSGSSVPTPFVLEYCLEDNRADEIEKQTHLLLFEKRLSLRREFFRCSLEEALEAIERAGEHVNNFEKIPSIPSGSQALLNNSLAVSAWRQRQHAKGLVKKDVWIRPEFASQLSALEKSMRNPNWGGLACASSRPWTLESLSAALSLSSLASSQRIVVHSTPEKSPILLAQMSSFGDLSVAVVVSGPLMMMEVLLWAVDQVTDKARFDALVLRTRHCFPRSNISIDTRGGRLTYIMSSMLDVGSSLSAIVLSLETLAANAIGATKLYNSFLMEAQS